MSQIRKQNTNQKETIEMYLSIQWIISNLMLELFCLYLLTLSGCLIDDCVGVMLTLSTSDCLV